MRVKPRRSLSNGEVDAFIAQRWRAGHSVSDIRFELDMRGTKLSRYRIRAGIRRYVEANSENSGVGKKRPTMDWTCVALAALQILVAVMLGRWLVWLIYRG